MAGTFTFNEVVIAASDCVSSGVEEAKSALACNMALYQVWRAFDWKESIADLPPFYLVPLTQDYGPPQVAVPGDFMGLRRAYYHQLSSGNDPASTFELTCPGDLAMTSVQSRPEAICYRPAVRKFRVHPMPPGGYSSPYHIIDGQYKKVPTVSISGSTTTITKLTSMYLNAALLPFNDSYLTMWVEAVKWAMMVLANDPKAGGVQIQNGVEGYTGQRATMMMAIGQMADTEAGELASPPMAPKESFMRMNWW